MKRLFAAFCFLFLSANVFSVTTVSETGLALTDCGGGVYAAGACPVTSTGNCDGAQGSAVAMEFNYYLAQNTGRFVPVSATSANITFNAHNFGDDPINWSTRYRQFQVGVPGSKNNVGAAAITEWVLETIPANGDLYLGKTTGGIIAAADYAFNDPDELWYKPDTSYIGTDSFTYCAIDSNGRSNIATINLIIDNPASYTLPLGFPTPTVAIDQSPPADPVSWPTGETANFYYIDSDHGSCTDANTYGYPNVPRCSLPGNNTTVTAGGKIVLADSNNPYPLRTGINWHRWNLNGSVGNPVWVVGNESDPLKPTISASFDPVHELRIYGDYFRFSGVSFDSVKVSTEDNTDTNGLFRHSIIKNADRTSGAAFGWNITDALIWNVALYDNGRIDSDLTNENDVHSTTNGSTGANYYYLDMLSYGNAGDSYQITNSAGSSNAYLGRWNSHSEMENCFDLKTFNNVLITESNCWDLRRVSYQSSGGNAQAFYLNDEGPQAGYAYFLNNRCWDTNGVCFSASNLTPSKSYFLGNVVLWAPEATGFNTGTGNGEKHVSLNTFANVDIGMNIYTSGGTTNTYYVGNLVHNATDSDLRMTAAYTNITLADYIAMTANPGVYKYGSNSAPTTASSLADFKTQTGKCTNCDEARTATFVNETLYDFSITAGTIVDFVPATIFGTGAGQDDALSDLNTDLSVTLQDLVGTSRPQNTNYDAGAYEDAP